MYTFVHYKLLFELNLLYILVYIKNAIYGYTESTV